MTIAISNAVLAEAKELRTAYGIGNNSCGFLTENENNPTKHLIYSWISGFVTSYEFNGEIELRESDTDALYAWVKKYCAENPLDSILYANKKLLESLVEPKKQ